MNDNKQKIIDLIAKLNVMANLISDPSRTTCLDSAAALRALIPLIAEHEATNALIYRDKSTSTELNVLITHGESESALAQWRKSDG